ncbi:MAG: glycosyltransferase [Candidatus Omnitrophica bacterium]|nr:glycosyltransferase [Candidatus Omnitrophota bacterium]
MAIPAFNASAHIEECLDRVFASEFREFETILIDDGSTDDTLAKVAQYPCRVLKNEVKQGAAHSRNRGMETAKGDLILLIDSDILIPPDFLNRVWNFFSDHPDVSILQGCYSHKPYYRNLLSQYKHYIFSFRGSRPGGTYINYVHTACVAMRREVFRKFRFDENLKRREDIELGLRCSENGYLIYADTSLTVGHKKRYSFLSYSKYQFATAKELVLQHLIMKNENFIQEFSSGKQPFYKRAWLLRPVLCFFALLNLIVLVLTRSFFLLILFIAILVLSFLLESRFRRYLFRVAPFFVSLGACWLYFYDGLLIGLGGTVGILQAFLRKSCHLGRSEVSTL